MDEAIRKATARAMCKMREDAGLTQVEVAQRLGLPQSVLSRWENARRTPTVTNYALYAAACGTADAALSDAITTAQHVLGKTMKEEG